MTLIEKYMKPFTDFGFEKFEAAEIARFSPEEKEQYEESLKSYRDLKNVIDTSFGEGKEQSKKQMASNMLKEGLNIDLISKITGLSGDEIGQLS